jgi:glycosyltransferase involved in cell wall biosynthesis
MKVLHVLGAYAPADFATGPPQQVHRLVCALRAGGADARVITTNTNGPTTLDVPAGRWTEHESVPVFYGRRVPGTFDLSFEGWRAVAREAGSYDLIHVTGIFSWVNLAAAAASRRRGVPVIVSPRGSLDPEGLKFSPRKKAVYFRFGGSRALNEAAGFHVTATRERDYVLALRPRVPVAVVPNGVVVPSADELRRFANVPAAAPTVLFLGRIHPKKNVIPLVRAWAAVLPRHAGARLVLAGPDDHGHSAEVRQTIAALGVENSVSLAGLVVGDDLSRLLATSRCLVLPSMTENFGNVVAEALAHRVPVIASTGTPWSGLRERSCGWWIAPTVEGLAGALRAALQAEPAELQAMGDRGRRWMTQEFSWPAFARRMADFYVEVLAGGSRGSASAR